MSTRNAFGIVAPHPPILIPEVGGERSKVTAASMRALRVAGEALSHYAPDVLVVMSPHAPAARDAFIIDTSGVYDGSLGDFGDHRILEWEGHPTFAKALLASCAGHDIPAVDRADHPGLDSGLLDHGVLVPLSVLDPSRVRRIVVISLSFLPYAMHRALGAIVWMVAESSDVRTAFLASGDLSHRLKPDAPAGYSPRAQDLDTAIVEHVAEGRLDALRHLDPQLVEEGGECGLRSVITLGGFAGDDPVPTSVLEYEGPWGVGYLTALVGRDALDAADHARHGAKAGRAGDDQSEIVALARRAIETAVRHGDVIAEASLPLTYPERAGAFVSLHREHELRGCIGTIAPTRASLVDEVIANGICAALSDPRFPPLTAAELADLQVEVDVLHDPEPCTVADLDPATYGVIVSHGMRRGLLLPALEGVDDVATQLSIALQKGGIGMNEPYCIERFRVDRYT